ncbi:hypothetical protein BIFDEN_02251 [Bifidobacterium dentium ATCC 27678]|nr:hypothetical protein BIFDEN_02251 [Bifidobacterium dentium ATCC 27678]
MVRPVGRTPRDSARIQGFSTGSPNSLNVSFPPSGAFAHLFHQILQRGLCRTTGRSPAGDPL